MDNKERADELLDKYSAGTASAQERAMVESWYVGMRDREVEISEGEVMAEQRRSWSELAVGVPSVKRRVLWTRVAAAAVLLLVMSVGLLLFRSAPDEAAVQIAARERIAPGKNGATLTLADGRKIDVADALAGRIASDAGVRIRKTADGKLVYEVLGNGVSAATGYNTLTTTVGEQIQVRLLDGTLVFLNAQSSLRYPASFAGRGKREVELTGEGYFEVAKDKSHPFLVAARGQQVEVLGTHFNISSYREEGSVRTTLVEGSVRVSPVREGTTRLSNSLVLKPDEQASFDGRSITVKEVDAAEIASWKSGKFSFSSESLAAIMKKAERWYGVQVSFEDGIADLKLTGSVSRFDNISGLLKTLEATEEVVFTVDGKKIMVNRKVK